MYFLCHRKNRSFHRIVCKTKQCTPISLGGPRRRDLPRKQARTSAMYDIVKGARKSSYHWVGKSPFTFLVQFCSWKPVVYNRYVRCVEGGLQWSSQRCVSDKFSSGENKFSISNVCATYEMKNASSWPAVFEIAFSLNSKKKSYYHRTVHCNEAKCENRHCHQSRFCQYAPLCSLSTSLLASATTQQ